MHPRWTRGRYLVSTDPSLIDLGVVHGFLANDAYWSKGIPAETVRRAIEHSLCFGVYDAEASRPDGRPVQVGFARVITDRATFAYLADVFVVGAHRRKGLAQWMMGLIAAHPELQGLRRWMLLTADAHELYRKFGFTEPARPERVMERTDPDIYRRGPC